MTENYPQNQENTTATVDVEEVRDLEQVESMQLKDSSSNSKR